MSDKIRLGSYVALKPEYQDQVDCGAEVFRVRLIAKLTKISTHEKYRAFMVETLNGEIVEWPGPATQRQLLHEKAFERAAAPRREALSEKRPRKVSR